MNLNELATEITKHIRDHSTAQVNVTQTSEVLHGLRATLHRLPLADAVALIARLLEEPQ